MSNISAELTNVPKGLGGHHPNNDALSKWVVETAALTKPDQIFWCDGSEEEKTYLTDQAVKQGVLIKLNQEKLPGCYYHRSNSNDVARVEQCTFICTDSREEAGPTNNWAAPKEMYAKMHDMLAGSMIGRTMFVIPYLMGPAGSPMTKVGVEITDSIYVVLNMRIMARIGKVALDQLGEEFKREGRGELFALLNPCLVGDGQTPPYAGLAKQLGVSEGTVKSAVHRMRQRYKGLVREAIAHTVAEPGEIEDELRHLFMVLAR